MTNEPVIFERVFNAPVEKVWKAITDKDQMKQWYFDLKEFKPVVGFEFQFEGGTEDNTYIHLCRITEVIPNRKLTYSWKYKGYAGNSFVTWELFDEGGKTRLKLTHDGLDTFPKENPDFAKRNFINGWTDIIGKSLLQFLEMAFIRLAMEINADPSKVWEVLVSSIYTSQWANEFSIGAYVETDWKTGSEVVWKDKAGNVGAKGVVTTNEPHRLLKINFYDDVYATAPAPTGSYSESYSLLAKNGKTSLSIEAGPLPIKDADAHSPLWNKAIEKMKALAEGH